VRAEDQFHVGIVVEDFEGTLARLSSLFGYELVRGDRRARRGAAADR
jgi:hypothetical protein